MSSDKVRGETGLKEYNLKVEWLSKMNDFLAEKRIKVNEEHGMWEM